MHEKGFVSKHAEYMLTMGLTASLERHSRDPRPVGDRGFTAQCAKNVVELLTAGILGAATNGVLIQTLGRAEVFGL